MAATPTAVSKEEQWSFSWDVFNHATYSPDLTPQDFHAFLGLHDFLGGQQFHDEESLKKAVTTFL